MAISEKLQKLAEKAKVYTQKIDIKKGVLGITAIAIMASNSPAFGAEIQNKHFGSDNTQVTQKASYLINHNQNSDFLGLEKDKNKDFFGIKNQKEDNKNINIYMKGDTDKMYKELPEDFKKLVDKRVKANNGASPGFRDAMIEIAYLAYTGELRPSENDKELKELIDKYNSNLESNNDKINYYDELFKPKQNSKKMVKKINRVKM